MRRVLKWIVYGLLCLALVAAALAYWKREEITRLLAVNSLFSPEKIVNNFSNMNTAFLSAPVPTASPVSELPKGENLAMPEGYDAWVKERAITSIVVLKDGKNVHEAYYLDTGETDRRISWSMAKSFLSVLLGVLIEEGEIESLDVPVLQYAPQLKGSAYDGATLRHVVNMASGIRFNEDYLDYHSDINRMGRVLALGGRMDDFASGLTETFAAPGTDWQYTSIDTHVIGMVIRGATGRSIPDLMSEKIVEPLGLEEDPYYLTDGSGVAFVLGGLNLRTRDYARFGQMIMDKGAWNGQQIVPANWITASTVPSAPTDPGDMQYGYQWWIPADAREGEFQAQGVYGQYIHFDKTSRTVTVVTAADRRFRERGVSSQYLDMFRKIARQ